MKTIKNILIIIANPLINLTGVKLEVFKLYGSMDTKNRNTQKILVNIEQGNL